MSGIKNALEAGDQLDSYRIDEVLSQTRTSSVFRATNLKDGQTVALKVPDTEMETDPFLLERFRRAAEIGEKLGHHGVMRVFSEVERSRVYMVMEWCEGKTLRQLMNSGRIPPERAIRIATAVLDALQYLHDNGVVHRSLTPECIMVADNDTIKLIDFGRASDAASRRLTYTNLADELGTVDYVSPEQVAGRRCDGRADTFSMGVILYEMLTGKLPFTGSSPAELMKARLVNPPIPPRVAMPSISPHLQEVLYRALEKEPRNRYARAHDFAHDSSRTRVIRPLRRRGVTTPSMTAGHERPREEWIEIPVPALVSEATFSRAQELFGKTRNDHAVAPSSQVSCRVWSAARSAATHLGAGSDSWRKLGGPVCDNGRFVRQDLLDQIVWAEVMKLLEDPTLIQSELDHRLAAARSSDPAQKRVQSLQRELVHVGKGIERLLTAYQEELMSIDQMRERMPVLRHRDQALRAELQAIADQANERAVFLRLAETLTAFLNRLRSAADTLSIVERQRIVRLLHER
jgi:serine/threonine protein kinase